MNWSNVKLIWLREVRDQLRDRRTLFMIAVLPILLYPLLGMSFLQVAQFMQEHPTKVLVVGFKPTAGLPPLVEQQPAAEEGTASGPSEPAPPPKGVAAKPPAKYRFAAQWGARD